MKYDYKGVPLALAVFLVDSDYDYNNDPMTISATTLMRPLRQLALETIHADKLRSERDVHVADLAASRAGSAVHTAFELSWTKNKDINLARLGFTPEQRVRFKINPKPEEIKKGDIPVYLEQRMSKSYGEMTVTGKYDFIGSGTLADLKNTSVFKYIYKKFDDFKKQGSIYRALDDGDKITSDYMNVLMRFTDWKAGEAARNPDYPQSPIMNVPLELDPIDETNEWIQERINYYLAILDGKEELPYCSPEERWASDKVIKYYSKPGLKRATKVFKGPDAMAEILKFKVAGNKGLPAGHRFEEVPRTYRKCEQYCGAYPVCSQANPEYTTEGK